MFELFWADTLSCFVVLFAIINVLGNLPVIVKFQKEGKIISPVKAAFFAFFILILFFYVGEAFLRLFGVDFSSFAIAGSVVIFTMGFRMIFGNTMFDDKNAGKDVTVVPVVFPLLIGAGTFTTVLSLRAQYSDYSILWAIAANILVVYFVLKLSRKISALLSPAVLYPLQKFFGFILIAIAVKILSSNVAPLLSELISKR